MSHNGIAFVVNGVARGTLNFEVGTTYEFELTTGSFGLHPFILTPSSTGGFGSTALGSSAGVQGPNPATASGQVVRFTPVSAGTVFYQCSVHTGMGAAINVTAPSPTISGLLDTTIHQNTSSGPLAFTVSTNGSTNLTLLGISTNTVLVPANQIVFGGTGANRTVVVTPSTNTSGQTRISVVASNALGGKATNSFVLTVIPLALRILAGDSQSNTLEFVGLSNRIYVLEHRDALEVGSWQAASVPSPMTNGPVRLTNPINNIPSRFYRLSTSFTP